MVSQVLVTTLQSENKGDVSVFPVPVHFDWLRHLDAAGVSAFFVELLEAVRESRELGDLTEVERVISAWEETAYLMSSPANNQQLLEAMQSTEEIPFEAVRVGIQMDEEKIQSWTSEELIRKIYHELKTKV